MVSRVGRHRGNRASSTQRTPSAPATRCSATAPVTPRKEVSRGGRTMPHDDLFDHGTASEGFADHTHEENAGASHTEGLSAIPTVGSAGIVPMAEPLAVDTGGGAPGGTVALTPNPEGPGTIPGIPGLPGTIPQLPQLPQLPGP